LAIIILFFFGIILIIWAGLRTPPVQNIITNKVIKILSERTGADIKVGKARFTITKRLIIKELLIPDNTNDTLIYINELSVGFKKFNINSLNLDLSKIKIEKAKANIIAIDENSFNYSYLTENIKQDSSIGLNMNCMYVTFKNINIVYSPHNGNIIQVSNLYSKLRSFSLHNGVISFKIPELNCNTNTGVNIKNLSSNIVLSKNNVNITETELSANNSYINIESIFLSQNHDDRTKFTCKASINESYFIPSDFKYFNNNMGLITDPIDISGIFAISETAVFGKSAVIKIDNYLLADLNFNFPYKTNDTTELFVNNITVKPDIIFQKYQHLADSLGLTLPMQLKNYNNISYNGKIKYANSYISNEGTITSRHGDIFTKAVITANNKSEYNINGYLQATPLRLPKGILNNNKAKANILLSANGNYSKDKGFNIDISGGLKGINYNDLLLDSLNVKGKINGKTFTGRLSSFDSRLRLDIQGTALFDSIPEYHFTSNIYTANMNALGVKRFKENSDISMNIKADFTGNDYKNFEGELSMSDIFYSYDSTYFATDSIKLTSGYTYGIRDIKIESEYINAQFQGNINLIRLIDGVKEFSHYYLPSQFGSPSHNDTVSRFQFFIRADYPQPITEIFFPEISISSGSYIEGEYNAIEKKLWSRVLVHNFRYKDKEIESFELLSQNIDSSFYINMSADKFIYTNKNSIDNIKFSAIVSKDTINTYFNWSNWLQKTYSGNIHSLFAFNNQQIEMNIYKSDLIYQDTVWQLSESKIIYDTSGITLNNINFKNDWSLLNINGRISNNPNDSISINLVNVNLSYINAILQKEKLQLGGNINGNSTIKNFAIDKKLNLDLYIDNLTINDKLFGNTELNSIWDANNNNLLISGNTHEGNDTSFLFSGSITPATNNIDCKFEFNNLNLTFLEAFLNPTLINIDGKGNGKLHVKGILPSPDWEGYLYSDFKNITVKPTNVNYSLLDTIYFSKNKILFNKINVYDEEKNIAIMNGEVSHSKFKDYYLGLRISTGKIIGLNTNYSHHPRYYGKGYGSGIVSINGSIYDTEIKISASTLKNSILNIPLEGKSDIKENDFIEFITPEDRLNKPENKTTYTDKIIYHTKIRLDLTVTPDAEIRIMFDPQYGDYLSASGNAEITMESVGNDFNMFGDFVIYNGNFMFTIQGVINKKLEIEQGSTVSWTGNPEEANIDIDAVYKVRRVSLYDLTLNEDDKQNKIPVDCHLIMSNTLNNPDIKFEVNVPTTTNDETVNQINSLPPDEINKQVISLLLLNKFSPLPGLTQNNEQNTSGNFGATTASELLSNQLSSWLSQITSDIDMGIKYRPGDEVSEREVELALSTTFWDDRISVNGNFGYNANSNENINTNNTQTYTTDFQVELKLNKKGNIRLTAFNKANNDYIYNTDVAYTQGLGIFYTDEFSTFDQLMQKMFRKSFAVKPEDIEIKNEPDEQ